jgi:hypothetical protein
LIEIESVPDLQLDGVPQVGIRDHGSAGEATARVRRFAPPAVSACLGGALKRHVVAHLIGAEVHVARHDRLTFA